MRLLIALLPWLELFTLIELGIKTSALTAIAYVLLTLMLGMAILQRQGRGMFERLRESQQGRLVGPQLLLDDMALGLAGALLMIPGLISDFAAIIVVIGPLRRRLATWILGPQPEPYAPERDQSGHVTLEGQYRRVDDDKSI
ncbi:MAG: FxsA family protein [Pseudomonadales bacterium]|nr:FxsA family protein [Pseudomonadales bacterium]